MLSLTDHDDIGGLAEAAGAAREAHILFIPGVEISVTWTESTVHVVGLGIDPAAQELADGLARLCRSRQARAAQIASQLDVAGIPGSLSGAARHADNASAIGRSHFARFLIEKGHARNTGDVFRRYLTPGKPGYVAHRWASLEQAIGWIRSAGGHAVLAHPDRYRLSQEAIHGLLDNFKHCGGEAIEIGGGARANPHAQLRLARHFGFALSVGSDFHAPGGGTADLGDMPAIPSGFRCIWHQNFAMRAAA